MVEVMQDQVEKLAIVSRAFHTDTLAPFLEEIIKLTGLHAVLPMNTGAEAVETAIKAARRWGYHVKGIAPDQAEIIVMRNNFHGRTTTITSFSTEEAYKEGFGPFAPGFVAVEFGNSACLGHAITERTCAVLLEPMQGEAGIVIPETGWLKEVQTMCKEHNILLIVDEIQTGLCRTGKMFAYQHEIDKPDGLILGKALGGGMMPVSAFVGREDVMAQFVPGNHGSTFGGNPLGARVGYEALKLMQELKLAERSAELGGYMLEQLRSIDSPLIKDVRGRGLWIGVEIEPSLASARVVCEKLMERGILSKETHKTVVRFAPPLIIEQAEIDVAVGELREVLGILASGEE